MTFADGAEHWVTECEECRAIFRDGPETAGVCVHCGHENAFSDA